jgi:GH18 family chitinase
MDGKNIRSKGEMIRNNIVSFVKITVPVLVLFTNACSKETGTNGFYLDKPACSETFIPKSHNRQVVGFYPSWKQDVMAQGQIPWDKLTRIVYAFAQPNTNGTLYTSELTGMRSLRDSAHAHGVEAYFSIGGADGSANFHVMAENEKTRKKFINEVKQYVFENCLDGVDIDWEYWSGDATGSVVPAESNALVTVLRELREELSPFGVEISVDLGASDWWGRHYYDGVAQYADHLMVMAYDFTGTWTDPGQHSSYEDAIGSGNSSSSTGLAYYVNYRGWPSQKILLGVPFYGKDFDIGRGMYIAYVDILKSHPDAYLHDQVQNIYYNGVNTISEKARYILENDFSGIMIWEISQDSGVDSLSLLNAIDRTLN